MANNIYTAGLNNVGTYQVSGIPYLSGALDFTSGGSLNFPNVTRWIQITNSASVDLLYGYSANGAGASNVGIIFPNSTTPRLEVKVTEMYFEGGADGGTFIAAGLTNLPIARVDNIGVSGPNWSGSVGVG